MLLKQGVLLIQGVLVNIGNVVNRLAAIDANWRHTRAALEVW